MFHNVLATNATEATLIAAKRASSITSFMSAFYTTSDNPTAHEEYAGFFTKDATLIIGGGRAEGYDEIVALRQAIWTTVSSRKHTVTKIFFGGENDLMLHGSITYVMKPSTAGGPGKEVTLDWAGWAEFDPSEDPKMKYYQVYLDTAAAAAAAAAAR